MLGYARREFYGSSSIALWTLRLGAENPNTRFTAGVSSYSDFRAILIYRCEEGKRFKIVGPACNLSKAKSKTVKRDGRSGAFPAEYFKG